MQPQTLTREEEEAYTPKTQSVCMVMRSMTGGEWNQRERERERARERERDSERARCWQLERLDEPLLWYIALLVALLDLLVCKDKN